MKKHHILLAITLFTSIIVSGQIKIELNDTIIDLKDIPNRGYLKLSLKKSLMNSYQIDTSLKITETKIYTNNTKDLFVVANNLQKKHENTSGIDYINLPKKGIIEVCRPNGQSIWKKAYNDKQINDIVVTSKGKKTIVNWISDIEEKNSSIIEVYDSTGNEIVYINNIQNYYVARHDDDKIFYFEENFNNENPDHLKKLFCFNHKDRTEWNYKFDDNLSFNPHPSLKGKYVLCYVSGEFIVLNSKGKLTHSFKAKNSTGKFAISDNGSEIINFHSSGAFSYYNNKLNLFNTQLTSFGDVDYIIEAFFIPNLKDYIAITYLTNGNIKKIGLLTIEKEPKLVFDNYLKERVSDLNIIMKNDSVEIYVNGKSKYKVKLESL